MTLFHGHTVQYNKLDVLKLDGKINESMNKRKKIDVHVHFDKNTGFALHYLSKFQGLFKDFSSTKISIFKEKKLNF